MKDGKRLARYYKLNVREAYAHRDGNWYVNLERFPAAYFDATGYIIFQTEADYQRCVNLSIGPLNTGVRNKDVGMSIKDIAGYKLLDPPPISL
jgi:hypothetical protein